MISKKSLSLVTLFILLSFCLTVSAETNVIDTENMKSWTKMKDDIVFQNDVDISKINIEKYNKNIKISSNEHIQTKIKIKESDIKAITNNNIIQVTHYTDAGIQDWSKIVPIAYENGYMTIDVEFSSIKITPVMSSVKNWNFEAWDSYSTPTDWTAQSAGGAKTTDAKISSYGYKVIGGSGNRGGIAQPVSLSPSTDYVMGCWIKKVGITTGHCALYVYDEGAQETVGSLFVMSGDSDWIFHETTVNVGTRTGPFTLRYYNFATPVSGYTIMDGVVLGKKITTTYESEYTKNGNVIVGFNYRPDTDVVGGVLVNELEKVDLRVHGKLGQPGSNRGSLYYASNMLYYDLSGITLNQGEDYYFYSEIPINQPPELYSPANGATISFTSVSMTTPVTFTWEDTGTVCKIQVAEDTGFSNIVYEHETDSDTATADLLPGTFYWRVLSYDPTDHVWSNPGDTWNFVTVTSSSSVSGTGIAGFIYESTGLGQYNDLAGATVTIYNNTFTTQKVTGAAGYYQVLGLSNGTYFVVAEMKGYDDSNVAAVEVVNGKVSVQYISMMKSQSYFAPHYVTFKLCKWMGIVVYPDIGVTVYENSNTVPIYTGTTGTNGEVGFELSENIRYRLVFSGTDTDGTVIYAEWEGYPTRSSYTASPGDTISATVVQPLDVVNYGFYKADYNVSHGNITAFASSLNAKPIDYTFRLYEIDDFGTINTSAPSYTRSGRTVGNASHSFFAPLGHDYRLYIDISHPNLAENVTVYRMISLYGGIRPQFDLGWEKQWQYEVLGYVLMLLVAGLFGAKNINVGAICVCGVGWFNVWAGWFQLDLAGQVMAMLATMLVAFALLTRRG